MKILSKFIASAGFIFVLIAGCQVNPQPVETGGHSESSVASSADSVQSSGFVFLRIITNNYLVKTIEPDVDMSIDRYNVSGIGPNGSNFCESNITTNAFCKKLNTGDWVITVDAANSSNVFIATGSTNMTIQADITNSTTILMKPYYGSGTFTVFLNWPNSLPDPAVTGYVVADNAATNTISFTVTGNTSSFSENLPAGYYLLFLNIFSGSEKVWGTAASVRILKDQTTKAVFSISNISTTNGTVYVQTGGVVVTVSQDLQNPDRINLLGVQSRLPFGSNMTIAATNLSSPVFGNCSWYLNGEVLPGNSGSSITLGSNLPAGNYSLTLISVKSNVISSTDAGFIVQKAFIPADFNIIVSNVPGYPDVKEVNFNNLKPGGSIYYSFDGSDPKIFGELYSGPVYFIASAVILAAEKSNGIWSDIKTNSLIVNDALSAAVPQNISLIGKLASNQQLTLNIKPDTGYINSYSVDWLELTNQFNADISLYNANNTGYFPSSWYYQNYNPGWGSYYSDHRVIANFTEANDTSGTTLRFYTDPTPGFFKIIITKTGNNSIWGSSNETILFINSTNSFEEFSIDTNFNILFANSALTFNDKTMLSAKNIYFSNCTVVFKGVAQIKAQEGIYIDKNSTLISYNFNESVSNDGTPGGGYCGGAGGPGSGFLSGAAGTSGSIGYSFAGQAGQTNIFINDIFQGLQAGSGATGGGGAPMDGSYAGGGGQGAGALYLKAYNMEISGKIFDNGLDGGNAGYDDGGGGGGAAGELMIEACIINLSNTNFLITLFGGKGGNGGSYIGNLGGSYANGGNSNLKLKFSTLSVAGSVYHPSDENNLQLLLKNSSLSNQIMLYNPNVMDNTNGLEHGKIYCSQY